MTVTRENGLELNIQFFLYESKLFECILEIIDNLSCYNLGGWQILRLFECLIFDPEDIEIRFISFHDLFDRIASPSSIWNF